VPVEVRVPPLGESVFEATVGRWRKREGEPVTAGEPLVELETEKVTVEVPAERSGVLARIHKREGETVRVGEVLAEIAEAAPAPAPPAAAAPPAPAPAPPSPAPAVERRVPPGEITPVARRLAEEYGVDLSQVRGTGPGGRITKEDVLAYLAARAPAPAPAAPAPPPAAPAPAPPAAAAPPAPPPTAPPPAPAPAPPAAPAPPPTPAPPPAARREERIRMSRRRLTIARRLKEAQQTAAMLTTFNEVDMTAIQDLRRRYRDPFEQRYGVRLGIMAFFVKATVAALKAFPYLNAEIQGEEIVLKYYYDIGIAVATPEGLVVPVVRDADRKSFIEIEREIDDLARRARENKLTLADLQGGTFTITNGGIFGSLLSTPILNPPQVGILGMHKIQDRPVALNGQVVIRPMMYLALTYDHRIVDGQDAILFLVRVKELLEDPERLLLEG